MKEKNKPKKIVAVHFAEMEWMEPVYIEVDDAEKFEHEELPRLLEEAMREIMKRKEPLLYWDIIKEFKKVIEKKGMKADVKIIEIDCPYEIAYLDSEFKELDIGGFKEVLRKEFIEEIKEYVKKYCLWC